MALKLDQGSILLFVRPTSSINCIVVNTETIKCMTKSINVSIIVDNVFACKKSIERIINFHKKVRWMEK